MKRVAIDLHYLPSLEFFTAIAGAEELLIFPQDTYQRQSYLNRTRIRLANKVETLSIPIQGRRPRVAMSQVRIDNSQKWQAIHLRGIQSAYGKAPFFEFLFPYFQSFWEKEQDSLYQLNLHLLTICLKLLKMPVRLTEWKEKEASDDFLDIRAQIKPQRHFSERDYYLPHAYPQLFGLDFEPNLSILDLLFCMGPESGRVLKLSQKISEQ